MNVFLRVKLQRSIKVRKKGDRKKKECTVCHKFTNGKACKVPGMLQYQCFDCKLECQYQSDLIILIDKYVQNTKIYMH